MSTAKKKGADANERVRQGQKLDPTQTRPLGVPRDAAKVVGTNTTAIPLPKDAPLPAFPIEALNTTMRMFAEAVAEDKQVPVDMPAMLMVVALAVALGKKVAALPREGHREPLCLYVLILMPSGSNKSGTYSAVFDPIEEWERSERARTKPERQRIASDRKVLTKRIAKLEKTAAESDSAQDRAQAQADLLGVRLELEKLPSEAEPRLLAGDVTLEKLAMLMHDNGGRMAVARAEAAKFFSILSGKYSKTGTADYDLLLSGHAGEQVTVDRSTAPSYSIQNATLTIGLTGQLQRASDLVKMSGDSGLSARFAFLYPKPINPSDINLEPDPVPSTTKDAWLKMLTRLLDLRTDTWPNGDMKEARNYFSREALDRYTDFRRDVNRRRSAGGMFTMDLRLMEWGAKFHGLVARLAGLLHLADRALLDDPAGAPITGDAVRRAILIGEYLAQHARHAFDAAHADDAWAGAHAVHDFILAKEWPEVDEHALMNKGPNAYRKKAKLAPALTILENYGFLQCTSERGERNRHFLVDASASRPQIAPKSQVVAEDVATDKAGDMPPPGGPKAVSAPEIAAVATVAGGEDHEEEHGPVLQ